MTRKAVRRGGGVLGGVLDALVVAGLLSTTANTIENELEVSLVAARAAERVSRAKVLRRGARHAVLVGGLRTAAFAPRADEDEEALRGGRGPRRIGGVVFSGH